MTLMLSLDLDSLQMCLRTKNEVVGQGIQSVEHKQETQARLSAPVTLTLTR